MKRRLGPSPVTRERLRLGALALALALVPALASAPGAGAHAAFVAASPAPGERVAAAPRGVTLTFSEPLDRRSSTARLSSAAGSRSTPAALATRGAARLVVIPRRAPRKGAYRVTWRAVSARDGHTSQGSFSFGVRAPAAAGAQVAERNPLAVDGWLRIALRGVFYAAALLFVAALVLPRLLRSRPSWLTPDHLADRASLAVMRERERRLVGDLGWLATGSAAAAAVAEAADAAGSLAPAGVSEFLLTGAPGAARAAVVLLLAVAVVSRRRAPALAAALGVVALGAVAASGNGGSAPGEIARAVNDWLHLLGGAIWLGGTGLLALVWGPALRRGDAALRRAVAGHVIAPLARVALPAFGVVVATGIVSLATRLDALAALWETPYGRLLAVKSALVAAIAAAAAQHALRPRRRLLADAGGVTARDERRDWRVLAAQPVLGIAVVVLVALLVAFPVPPRQGAEGGSARAAARACGPCPVPAAAADELAVAGSAGSRLVAGWIRRSPGAVSGIVRISDIRGRPARAPFRLAAVSARSCGTGCRRFRGPAGIDELAVTVTERDRTYSTRLPTRWRADASARARRLVGEAQDAMRRLRSVREVEEISSGPDSYARTDYRLLAPSRMALRTDGGVEKIIAGDRQWLRVGSGPWQPGEYGAGLPFRLRRWFGWSIYARSVRLLDVARRDGRRVAELALFDQGTPVWLRLTVDLASRRILREQTTAKGHFMTARYFAFDRPLRIALPRSARDR